MSRFLVTHRSFVIGYILFILFGAIVLSTSEKGQVILWVNSFHRPLLDTFFLNATRMAEVFVIGVFTVIYLLISFRKALLIPVLGVTATVISGGLKALFQIPRPYRVLSDLGLQDQIHIIDQIHINQGLTSFPSGHTLTAFAVFCYLALLHPGRTVALVYLTIAILVGISRIYLVQHFFADVYFGAILGFILAVAGINVHHGLEERGLFSGRLIRH